MKRRLLPLFSGKSTRTKDTAVNLHWIRGVLPTFKSNKNKHVSQTNWCENHSSDLWSFRWSEMLWLTWQNLVYTRRELNVTNSKLDWAVVFTARYARWNRKTVNLCARLRKPSKTVAVYLATTRDDILGNGNRSIRLRGLGAALCKQAKTVKNLLVYTRKPREL